LPLECHLQTIIFVQRHEQIAEAEKQGCCSLLHNKNSSRQKLDIVKKDYEGLKSNEVADKMLDEAAKLFSKNYGVWGEHAAERMGKFEKAGRYSVPQVVLLN
jgi:hypothetical protein